MGRPERPLDPEAGVLARFALDLRDLRRAAGGLSYRQLARRAHYSVTALSEAAGGEHLPTLAVTLAYVGACGGDVQEWETRWHAVAAERAAAVQASGPAHDGDLEDKGASDAPYLGLSPFQPEDAERFFGRERLVAELLERLGHTRFLAVFGTSGSGKSSLLRAGLLPAIGAGDLPGSRDWITVLLSPGEHPLEELAVRMAAAQGIAASSLHAELAADPGSLDLAVRQALTTAPAGAELLIVVDQFEELFTLCQDAEERTRFVEALVAAASGASGRARVVLGIRADFYGHCADHPPLVSALRNGQVLVGPMAQEDLRSAIVRPAASMGVKVAPDLVATILGDVAGEPGALPLVSHALQETWKRRRNGALTLAAYQAAGGVRGAIAQTAEHVHQTLGSGEQRLARRIFLRLCALGEGSEDTCRRVRPIELQSLSGARETTEVLERLAAARLIILGDNTVEIAHEALIREWPRLRQWLMEDREGLRIHRQLTEAALGWESLGRDAGSLYRGSRLIVAREWAGRDGHREELNPLERSFLDASSALETSERMATQRRTRRLRLLSAGLTVLLAIAVAAGTMATRQRQLAVSRELAALAGSLATTQPPAAALLSAAAFRRAPTAEARGSLLSLAASQSYDAILSGHAGLVRAVAFSPDSRMLASAGVDRTIILWDVSRRARVGSLSGHSDAIRAVAFSPGGRTLASAGKDGTIRMWDVASRREIATLGVTGAVYDVAFSPDGRTLASAGSDGTVRLWDPTTRQETADLEGHGDEVYAIAFSPDGAILASASKDRAVRLWDVARRTETARLEGHTGEAHDVAFSPDGRLVASGGQDWKVILWDAASHAPLATLERRARQEGHTGAVRALAFSPNGGVLASADAAGTIMQWDLARRVPLTTLVGHTGAIYGMAYSPDGRTLASASYDHTVILWPGRSPFTGHTDVVNAVAFSPDGRTVASMSKDGTARLWDVRSRQEIDRFPGVVAANTSLAISQDGRLLAGTGPEQTVKVWDVSRHQEVATLAGHTGAVTGVAFATDGHLASSSADRTVRLWDVGRHQEVAILTGHTDVVEAVAFSPDGRILASGGLDRTVVLWDVARRTRIATLPRHPDGVTAVTFSPDGRVLAAATSAEVKLWDVSRHKEIGTVTGHAGPVTGVAFSADGRLLASSSLDETAVLWDVKRAARLATLKGNASSLTSVAFSPDGRQLAAGGWDKKVVLWTIDADTAVKQVCRVVGHSLPAAQRTPLDRVVSYQQLCG